MEGANLYGLRRSQSSNFRVADITGQSLLTSQGYGVCAFR